MTRLAYWRQQRGVSQRALAARTGISEKTIERLDQGLTRNPNIRHLLAIAHVLRVPVMELVEEDWRAFLVSGKSFRADPPTTPD
jgi:transcriptional regulator with XRE-family HTH domain